MGFGNINIEGKVGIFNDFFDSFSICISVKDLINDLVLCCLINSFNLTVDLGDRDDFFIMHLSDLFNVLGLRVQKVLKIAKSGIRVFSLLLNDYFGDL